MYDPFRSITIEAGTIPPPQQEMLRRRRFLRQPPSPPPSSSSEETEDTSRFRISEHPIAMRSASDSSYSSSDVDRSARVSEVTSKGKKRSRTRQPEVICFPSPNLGFRDSSPEKSALKLPLSGSNLVDLLLKFAKPVKSLENVDFLEVLSMKGISISPPRWWRAEGYGSREI